MILAIRDRLQISDRRVRLHHFSDIRTTNPTPPIQILRKVIIMHPDIHYLFDVARAHDDIEEETGVRTLDIFECSERFAGWYRYCAGSGETYTMDTWPIRPYDNGDYSLDVYTPEVETDGDALVLLDIVHPSVYGSMQSAE